MDAKCDVAFEQWAKDFKPFQSLEHMDEMRRAFHAGWAAKERSNFLVNALP